MWRFFESLDAETKLSLVIGTPAPHFSFGIQCQNVGSAGCNFDYGVS